MIGYHLYFPYDLHYINEFIVFRSPQLRCDLSGLSVNVGESDYEILKVIDLVVMLEQFLNFHDHITAICRNT